MSTPRRMRVVVAGFIAFAAVACGGSRANPDLGTGAPEASQRAESRRTSACARVDSVFLRWAPVYTECDVDKPAKLLGRQMTNFQPQRGDPVRCFRTVLDVVINSNGDAVKESIRIEKSTSSAHREAVIAGLTSERYTPAQKDGQAVAQIMRVDRWVQAIISTGGSRPPPPSRPSC